MSDTNADSTLVVGIDLGTTHTALAIASLDDKDAPEALPLPQVVQPHERQSLPLLPSFLYLPAPAELPPGALSLPWDDAGAADRTSCVGTYARDRAAHVPGRVIASAKSWLCHAGVDRRAPILPFGQSADSDVERLSPVVVQARLLQHLREAFEHARGGSLADHDVVLTVPASFDAVARALTEEAARSVGITRLTLLEEPQAALYAWLAALGDAWRKQVKPGDVILVVDIGGGTTDFSLIEVQDDGGNLGLTRQAVGDHILLGGDNMDLALAYRVKAKLESDGKSVDDWQLRALTHACRVAKEGLLLDETRASWPIALPSRGKKLLGGTLSTELARAELDEVLLEGFFPVVDKDARPQAPRRAGFTSLGLPYAQDAGVTRHLAAFLASAPTKPTCVLWNGGVTKSALLRERLLGIVSSWLSEPLRVLSGADLDLAVARGAAAYARARRGQGLRIKGGAARAYYVGIERAELAVPGVPPRVDAICIAPKGMEEGTSVELSTPLGLYTGEAATFRFFSSSGRDDEAGASVDPVRAELTELPAIETTLPRGDAAVPVVPVHLQARVTEVGTLELFAVEDAGGARHKLEFSIRTA